MQRRQFLLSSLAGAAGVLPLPALARTWRDVERPPLVLHTAVLRPSCDPEAGLPIAPLPNPVPRQWRCGGTVFGLGQVLDLQLESSDMGHYRFALDLGGQRLRSVESAVLGACWDRGEPLRALVTDVSVDHVLRVDVLLDRPIRLGERLPLLDPVTAVRGVLAQLEEQARAWWPPDPGWHPLRGVCWHQYSPHRYGPPESVPGIAFRICRPAPRDHPGLLAIRPPRRRLYNDTPWRDLDPVVAVLTQGGRDLAYVPWAFGGHAEQLLLRGERVEGRLVAPGSGYPGAVQVDLSVVG